MTNQINLTSSFPKYYQLLICLLLSVLVVLLPYAVSAQAQKNSISNITNFYASDYKAGPQNWAIVQDARGVMYVGNSQGLLAFDGVNWRKITMPNKSEVRSLALDNDGRVYVGAQGDFGYLKVSTQGKMVFHSLVNQLPEQYRDFAGVPNIHVLSRGVVFHTLKRMYLYEHGNFKIFEPDELFQLSFNVRDRIYVNESGSGLHKLQGNILVPIPNGQFFADKRIELMLPYGKENWLIATEQHGLFLGKLDDDVEPRFETFQTSIPNYFKQFPAYCGLLLPNGDYALGTHQNGLVMLSQQGEVLRRTNQADGLQNNLIWSMNLDQQQNLWLGLDDGIAHISTISPFTQISPEQSVLSTIKHENQLYLGTTQGVFVTDWSEENNNRQAKFDLVKGTKEQAWSFTKADGDLLCAHISGVFQLTGKQVVKVSDDYTWAFTDLGKNHPKKLLAGTSNKGLILLEKRGNRWLKSKEIQGFEESSRYLAVDASEHVWVSHPYKGVFRMKLSKDMGAVEEIELFTDADGLPATTYNFVFKIHNRVLFATSEGIYVFNYSTGKFEADRSFEPVSNLRKLATSGDRIWFAASQKVGFFQMQATDSSRYRVAEKPILNLLNELLIYSIYDTEKATFFGTPNGLIRYTKSNANADLAQLPPATTLIREVYDLSHDSVLFWGNFGDEQAVAMADQLVGNSLELSYAFNDLRFKCAATWFEQLNRVEYQFLLDGFDEDWTAWSASATKDYTNLPEGSYTFRARARNAYGMVGSESSYTLEILPPIYRTWWAYIAYAAIILLLVYIGLKLYTSNLEREKKRLEVLVKKRTSEVVASKEEIERQNEVLAEQKDHLEELNEEKNHLIGVLAHDMRNPLHQIKGMSTIMKMKNPDMSEEEDKYLGIIEGAADHLNNMIIKILDLEAIESKKTNVQFEKVDLRHTLKVIVDSFQGRAADKEITLVPEIIDTAHLIKADRGFSMQVFENLVSNAIKFSPKGTNIYVKLTETQGKMRATIQDEGPGISEEDREKLFGKFQKLSARPTGGEKSTGLGLSIVKKYVEVMKGQVWCESELGKGAAFIVEFEAMSEGDFETQK